MNLIIYWYIIAQFGKKTVECLQCSRGVRKVINRRLVFQTEDKTLIIHDMYVVTVAELRVA